MLADYNIRQEAGVSASSLLIPMHQLRVPSVITISETFAERLESAQLLQQECATGLPQHCGGWMPATSRSTASWST